MGPLILVSLACTTAESPKEVDGEPDEHQIVAPTAPDWTQRSAMDEHFGRASEAMFALIEGDLDLVRNQAKALDARASGDLPEAWSPWVDELRSKSQALAAVQTTEDGAARLVSLLETCADCHTTTHGPSFPIEALTKDDPQFGILGMERHEWAVFRMWMGLIIPNAEVYNAGARGLVSEKGALPEFTKETQPMHDAVLAVGERALHSTTYSQRGEAFAALLPNCSSCHTTLNVELR